MTEPKAGRPHMPGYGILDADKGRGLLPWSWATERLAKAHTYWVATTRVDAFCDLPLAIFYYRNSAPSKPLPHASDQDPCCRSRLLEPSWRDRRSVSIANSPGRIRNSIP